jgi:hypothetical protein
MSADLQAKRERFPARQRIMLLILAERGPLSTDALQLEYEKRCGRKVPEHRGWYYRPRGFYDTARALQKGGFIESGISSANPFSLTAKGARQVKQFFLRVRVSDGTRPASPATSSGSGHGPRPELEQKPAMAHARPRPRKSRSSASRGTRSDRPKGHGTRKRGLRPGARR